MGAAVTLRAELTASLSQACLLAGMVAEASQHLQAAAEAATAVDVTNPPHIVARARQSVRAAGRQLRAAHPTYTSATLPNWITADPSETNLATLNAWTNATSTTDRLRALDDHPTPLPDPTLALARELVNFLYAGIPPLRDLAALLDDMKERGVEPVLDHLRKSAATEQALNAWIVTQTWTDSFTYLEQHLQDLTERAIADQLAGVDEPWAQQHAAILYLLATERSLQEVEEIVTDPDHATQAAEASLDSGDVETTALILTATDDPTGWGPAHPLTAALLAAAGGGAPDAANQLLDRGTQDANPNDLDAYAVHLRRFLTATKDDDGLDDARAWAQATIDRLTSTSTD